MSDKTLISFDYAIKYLLKDKGDHEIVEGFISALLATEGYKPVKINALLETESNKETSHLKKSIADLVVQDEDDNKYIVEIERSYTPNFMHKACFNTSRLVVDSISGNQDYTTIKKVFHISLLYFSTQEMRKPIYHGKTIIHEIDTAHPVTMRIANQGLVMFEHRNIFPEYFFISIPLFDEKIYQEIDEWLYMMKHSEVRSDFKSPYMEKVKERLAVLKMSDEERAEYYNYLKEAVHSQDVLTAAEQKGEKRGIEKGRAEGKEAMFQAAKNLLAMNMSKVDVSKATGLSMQEIEGIKI
jgi:predicted transposase/invertase (TIGR01784 family)